MSLRVRRWSARALLLASGAGGVLWLASLDHRARISTDVLELMPAGERDPDLALVRTLAGERQGRVALFALSIPAGPVPAAAEEAFVESLRGSGAFRDVLATDAPEARDAAGRFVFEHRFDHLLPDWLEERRREFLAERGPAAWPAWLAGRVTDGLEEFLSRPEAIAFEAVLPADPLLLLANVAEELQGLAEDAAGEASLIWAEAAAPPLREEGQGPVFAAVDAALARAQALAPDARLEWTALSRFAAESRRRIEAEVKSLNLFAILAVAAVLAIALRRPWQIVHLVPVMLCALLGAWVATTALFPRTHVLVLVLGSLLGGVAVDYALHVHLHRGRPGAGYGERLRALRRPLAGSALTTLLGFSLLAASELPLLRQLGVFVCAGVLSALAATVLWFAQVGTRAGATRLDGGDAPRRPLPPGARAGLAAVAAVALFGLTRLHWHDDIRELEIPAPELWEGDRAVRARFGQGPGRELLLTRGRDAAEARESLERLREWLAREAPEARLASLGRILPTAGALAALPERVAELGRFEDVLADELGRRGFTAEAFAPFFAAWSALRARGAAPDHADLAARFAAVLRGPASTTLELGGDLAWFGVVLEDGPVSDPPPDTATVRASRIATLNDLFARHRRSALTLSLAGLALVGVSALALFGLRRGARMATVPLGAVFFVFGVFGLTGATLNLFHLLGAFLAVAMTIDYAIFAGADGAGRVPASVRLSALSTAASFGVLALSAIPVVSALGVTVAAIILCGWGLVELTVRSPR